MVKSVLSKFEEAFVNSSDYLSWNEEKVEFIAKIEKIFESEKYKNSQLCVALCRFRDGTEKKLQFGIYAAMQTQFTKLGITENSVIHLKHLGKSEGRRNYSCVVSKLE